jgi:3-mercaptopyruvate sulfurtransferase SseA
MRDDARVRLPEFLLASGDPANNALVEALDANYHFGGAKFFDRAGHVPNAIMLPTEDFYNADKTFKSAADIGRMLSYLGIRPEQQVHTYCGGGWAASVPFFAMKFMLNYPKVKLYSESQLEWLQDERGLPFWTYDAPSLKRDMHWLNGWSNRMMRAYGVTRLSVLDVRPAEAFTQGHVPYALNMPAAVFRSHLGNPAKLAELLGPAGVDAAHEAVIVADGGLNEGAALAFVMLESLGQKKVSVLMDSVDEWGLQGLPLSREATVIGPRQGPQDLSIPATVYPTPSRPGVLIKDATATQGLYPKLFIASGKTAPARSPDGNVVHVPFTDLLHADGTPKAAKDIWSILAKAGVPRYAEIICFADDPGAAAVNYFILRLMGYPDVKVLLT